MLAMVLVNKCLLHQPLNRQSKTDARESIEIDVSTLTDRVGACAVALEPLIEATGPMSCARNAFMPATPRSLCWRK
ncbi:IS66 family transposase [Bradyrhizobium sp. 25ACV]